jgi:hypothetical protein
VCKPCVAKTTRSDCAFWTPHHHLPTHFNSFRDFQLFSQPVLKGIINFEGTIVAGTKWTHLICIHYPDSDTQGQTWNVGAGAPLWCSSFDNNVIIRCADYYWVSHPINPSNYIKPFIQNDKNMFDISVVCSRNQLPALRYSSPVWCSRYSGNARKSSSL